MSEKQTLLVTDNGPQLVAPAPEHAGEGDTLIHVSHSSVNYKDAMALAGNKGVVRTLPLVPGIDAVGTLDDGTLVTVNGWGIGERRHGGFTPELKIDREHITEVPELFDAWTAAAIGTAGYTAALSVAAYERLTAAHPDSDTSADSGSPIAVTGATGGVGSIAIQLLAARGHTVAAVTGRVDEYSDYLKGLGATEVIDRAEFSEQGKPLQKTRFAGAIDTVGSTPLANLLAQVEWGGVVTACGLAAGADLPATVMPFILRGVNLAGINSVDAPAAYRDEAWALLAESLDVETLRSMTETVDLEGAVQAGSELLDGHARHGRTVVKL